MGAAECDRRRGRRPCWFVALPLLHRQPGGAGTSPVAQVTAGATDAGAQILGGQKDEVVALLPQVLTFLEPGEDPRQGLGLDRQV